MRDEGFFTKKETESKTRPDGKIQSCVACGLYKKCNTPRMVPYGNFKKKILVIGDSPGELDDKNGIPWQGKSGLLLSRTFKTFGIDLHKDCLSVYSVLCKPTDEEGDLRVPLNFEVECCRRSLLQLIEERRPHLILLFGNSALFSVIGHRWKKDLGSITKWRGYTIPDQDFKAWICPVYDPMTIEKASEKTKSIEEVIWLQDLKQAFSLLETHTSKAGTFFVHPFIKYKEPEIEIIEDLSVLDKIKSSEIAFDYETTGLKPHAEGHRIICASVADTEDHAYSFMMPETRKERAPLVRLLTNPNIGKVAQNMKFEHAWSQVRLRIEVAPWVWDTMLASHIFDNRPGVTGLKFQVFVQFGIVDYSSEIAPYLGAVDNKNGNAINKINQLLYKPGGKMRLLRYCGYDSVYELRLANKQRMNLLPF
jgi:uracil-DNA glycosylase family 4